MNLWLPEGTDGVGGRDRLGVWDWHVHSTKFKIDNQQGPTVRELSSIFCNNLWEKNLKKNIYLCV